jgi:hypothetical protein
MTKLALGLVLSLLFASPARSQVAIGDTQMHAWRQMKGFGLHLDSVVEHGKVRVYTADSIKVGGLLNHVTIFLNDSQRVSKMVFDARNIDSAKFAEKYELVLTSKLLTDRRETEDSLVLSLEHPDQIIDIAYDRRKGTIHRVDKAK